MVDKKVIILSTVAIILMIILVFICFGSNLSVFKQETDLVITSNSTLNNGIILQSNWRIIMEKE